MGRVGGGLVVAGKVGDPVGALAPLPGSDWDAPALGDCYNQAFDGSVSLPVAGYNYNSRWISFCWWDSHPLEWQLASLHGQSERSRHVHVGDSFRRKRASWPLDAGVH
jgi:hypothetical protein